MIWLPAAVLSAIATEVFAHLPIERSALTALASGSQAGRIILSPDISDHWKEKAMPAYALRMGRETLTLALCFGLLIGIVAVLMAFMDRIDPDAVRFILSGPGMAFSLIVSIVYYVARRRLVRA